MFDIFLSFACSKKFIPGGLTYTEVKMWTRDNHILSYRAYLWLYYEILGALKNTITFVKLFYFQIINLPSPYLANCTTKNLEGLGNIGYTVYSKPACLMRCLTEFVIKTCGCRPIENKGKKCLSGRRETGWRKRCFMCRLVCSRPVFKWRYDPRSWKRNLSNCHLTVKTFDWQYLNCASQWTLPFAYSLHAG